MKQYVMKLIGMCLPLLFLSCGGEDLQVVNLQCEYQTAPLAVDDEAPLLRWQLRSETEGKMQQAFRVLVAGSPEALEQGVGDCWDSGKLLSADPHVRYAGRKLASREQVWWKVMVWDEQGTPSAWSEAATWSMGLLYPSDWQAKWIGDRTDTCPDSTLTTPAPYFRKTFVAGRAVKKATAYVSGLGFYELYVNGRRVGDQVLAPAVTNYDKRPLKYLLYYYDDQSSQRVYYNVFDVTSLLSEGENVLGMMLGNGWYNQRDRVVEGHMWYDVPKLIMQLHIDYDNGTSQTVVSDESWKTTTGPLLHDAIFTGEVYDARRDLGAWNRAGSAYDDSSWHPALAVRPPTGELRVQAVPYNRVMGTVECTFEQLDDSTYRYALPHTVSGWCALRVQGKAGDRVRLRFVSEEEMDYGQADTYILKGGGTEEWEPRFTWHTFRWVEAVTRGVKLSRESLTVKDIYTDVERTGTFCCSNPLFNRIVQAHDRTMHANFKGIISSDPHRERLAYTGDGQVITEGLLYTYDMTRFLRKFIDDMGDARNPQTGYVPHTAPFGGGGGGPAWGSAYVIVPWAYFCHYGDTLLLQRHYEGMKQWVAYLGTRTDERGLVVREEPRGWCLGEWCTLYNRVDIPTELVNTAFYYRVTTLMARVARVLGKTDDQAAFEALARKIKDDFNTAFFDPATNHYWQGRQGSDVFALGFGLVPDERREAVFNALLAHLESLDYHFDTGIFGTPLLLEVLTEHGRADLAYRLMDQRDFPGYAYLLDDKNSTLWEMWDGGGDPGGRGHCHPMFGSVVAWFYRSLAGIRPDEERPGMTHFYVTPSPVGDLSYCKASYATLYGKVVSEWEKAGNGSLRLRVEVPCNTSATVVLPPWGNVQRADTLEVLPGRHEFVREG